MVVVVGDSPFVEGDELRPGEARGLRQPDDPELHEEMREAGAVAEDPVGWAEEILLVERARKLLVNSLLGERHRVPV